MDTWMARPVSSLKGIGAYYVTKLKKLRIETVGDLVRHFPVRYDDFSNFVSIAAIKEPGVYSIVCRIEKIKTRKSFHRRLFIVDAMVSDATGSIPAVWFGQSYLARSIPQGSIVALSGKVVLKDNKVSYQSPVYEVISRDETDLSAVSLNHLKHAAGLVPIYPETHGLTSRGIRFLIKPLLGAVHPVRDFLPLSVRRGAQVMDLGAALEQIHFPKTFAQAAEAKARFAFEELFLLQVLLLSQRKENQTLRAPVVPADIEFVKQVLETLPFELTKTQKQAAWDIIKDIARPYPMNRLLNGDVGSGKTIVAALALALTVKAGYQAVMLAPTEILARQHFEKLTKIFSVFGIASALLVSKEARIWTDTLEGAVSKKALQALLEQGSPVALIGTHAILQKTVHPTNVALVVVDEQHRFGIQQRAALLHGYSQIKARIFSDTQEEKLLYENLTYKIRGAIFNVYNELGFGLKENVYQKALQAEFKKINIHFESEKSIPIRYADVEVGEYKPDFIIENKIILEIKSVSLLGRTEERQIWKYLKQTQHKLCLLVNFGKSDLEIQRIIYDESRNNGMVSHLDSSHSASALDQDESASASHLIESPPRPAFYPVESAPKSASHPIESAFVPHFLSMSATPIPRTLALALWGDLDICAIQEMPKGRKIIETKVVEEFGRAQLYAFIKEQVAQGRQAFIICPRIEEPDQSVTDDEYLKLDAKAVKKEFERLHNEIFPGLQLGLLHGKMRSGEKEAAMAGFSNGTTNILVSTSVIEVGIDVPNASVMVIEGADSFGLAQLHQFRGRVGRGAYQSYCFLLAASQAKAAHSRLEAFAKTYDGFKLAEQDLDARGPGEFLGTRQSGIPDIAMHSLKDVSLVLLAKKYAQAVLEKSETLDAFPLLKERMQEFKAQIHLE